MQSAICPTRLPVGERCAHRNQVFHRFAVTLPSRDIHRGLVALIGKRKIRALMHQMDRKTAQPGTGRQMKRRVATRIGGVRIRAAGEERLRQRRVFVPS